MFSPSAIACLTVFEKLYNLILIGSSMCMTSVDRLKQQTISTAVKASYSTCKQLACILFLPSDKIELKVIKYHPYINYKDW